MVYLVYEEIPSMEPCILTELLWDDITLGLYISKNYSSNLYETYRY